MNLPLDSSDMPPNPFVIVSTISPSNHDWKQLSQTEIIDKCTDPQFLTTIGFGDGRGIEMSMRVRLAVYNVKERMSGTMNKIGQVVFTMSDVMMASNNKIQLRLVSQDYANAGTVSVMAWTTDSQTDTQDVFGGSARTRKSVIRHKPNRLDMLKCLCDNVFIKSFRFDTLLRHKLCVYEYMAESKLCFHIPRLLLSIWIDREQQLIDNLQDLGELNCRWLVTRRDLQEHHMNLLCTYATRLRFMRAYPGPNFKPSIKKNCKDLEFVPINLHVQRMTVDNESTGECGGYDTITSGAFMAYPHKFRNGGLRRLLKSLYKTYAVDDAAAGGRPKIDKGVELIDRIRIVKDEAHRSCDWLNEAVLTPHSRDAVTIAMQSLKIKVRELIDLCDDPLLDEMYRLYSNSRPFCDSPSPIPPPRSRRSPVAGDRVPTPHSTVRIANVEPWELSCINTDAALLCVQTLIDDFLSCDSVQSQSTNLADISHNIVKLKSFVTMLVKRAYGALTFLTLTEHHDNVPLLHTVKYRRDVVFSQALTTLATGFMTKLRTSIHDELFLRQLVTIGLLAEFESLLTCYGEEIGHVEDMSVGVADLRAVTFKIVPARDSGHVLPDLVANKSSVTLLVPLPPPIFDLVPRELQEGHLIKVVPIFFNIGINERATMGETLSDMSLQEELNITAATMLLSYCTQYRELITDPDYGQQNAESVENLCKQLKYNVTIKWSKNVEILHVAAEITRKLSGLRFVNCKSGKDRTSMGVTLEQVQLLQTRHSLASHLFNHALDCFRSEGVRRENTLKNVGVRKYAFTSLQLPMMPKLYRPPNGTYGNIQT